MPKARIRGIRIKVEPDYDADLSFYGEFTDRPSPDAIDLQRSGLWEGRGHYKYFEPAAAEGGAVAWRRYAAQDLARFLDYNRGEWQMVGICAEAEVEVPLGKKTISDKVNRCVFGVESDGGGAFLTETAREELGELKDELREMGFTDEEIESAPFDGSTELFDYGDTDVPEPRTYRLNVVFVGDPEGAEEEEPEMATEEFGRRQRERALAGIRVSPYVKFRQRRP